VETPTKMLTAANNVQVKFGTARGLSHICCFIKSDGVRKRLTCRKEDVGITYCFLSYEEKMGGGDGGRLCGKYSDDGEP
jgi:hypothetical protein